MYVEHHIVLNVLNFLMMENALRNNQKNSSNFLNLIKNKNTNQIIKILNKRLIHF